MRVALVEFNKAIEPAVFAIPEEAEGLEAGDFVVAESKHGISLARVMKVAESFEGDLPLLIRKASEDDLRKNEENKQLSKRAFDKCRDLVGELGLTMKLVMVEATLDRSKIVFYFVAPGRVDFRTLVKKLAAVFKARIEMRQIGVRDETRIVGGIGLCGEELCCSRFLRNFKPVSIKMAKDQNLNINIKKISGACGRLLCCLAYEQETYEEFSKVAPPMNSMVRAGTLIGKVVYINPIKKTVIIKDENNMMVEIDVRSVNEIMDKERS